MDIENTTRKQIMGDLRGKYDIAPKKGYKPDLSFAILNMGESFRHLYSWELKGFKSNAILCSIRNSYEQESLNKYRFFSKTTITGRYFILVLNPEIELPELIMRPAYAVDRVSNLFLRFDNKLKGRKVFNKNFIVETENIELTRKILHKDFTDFIENDKNLYIEISTGQILIKFEEEQSYETTNRIIEIGLLLDDILYNYVA